jgi:anti-sigma regulatory factor (Ser/Thr protein kinase)
MQIETQIEPDPARVAVVREWARERLSAAGVRADSIDVLVLLVSECVTNAILHAEPPLVLSLDVDADRTRVEVRDGTRHEPELRHPAPTEQSGRGVMIVDRLSSRWGTLSHDEPDDDGPVKTVWFELEHPADAVARAR